MVRGAESTPHDFFSPFMGATLITPDGDAIPFWVNIDDPGGPGVAAGPTISSNELRANGVGSLSYVTQISVVNNLGFVPRISVTMAPPYQEAKAILDSRFIEWTRSIIEIQMGYTHGGEGLAVLSPTYRGLTMKPGIALGREIQLTLNAQGVGGFLAVRREGGGSYNDKTRFYIIQDVLKKMNEGRPSKDQIVLDRDSFVKIRSKTNSVAYNILFKDVMPHYSRGFRKDWAVIRELLDQSRCWMRLDGNKLVVVPMIDQLTGEEPIITTFVMYDIERGELGPSLRRFPILQVSSPSSWTTLPETTRGLVSRTLDSRLARGVESDPEDSNPETPLIGGGAEDEKSQPNELSLGVGGLALKYHDQWDDWAKNRDKYFRSRVEFEAGIKLNIQTVGVPDVIPGQIVNVLGISERFSGIGRNYVVHKVTHTYNRSGFRSTLELISNAQNFAAEFQSTVPRDKDTREAEEGAADSVAVYPKLETE